MALGPKAMGEAIVANLKTKTGKDLAGWQAELTAAGAADAATAKRLLIERCLGQFQAASVAEYTFGDDHYADAERLVDDQFARYPEQRALYDHALDRLAEPRFTPKPCRTYLPVYRDGRIAVSFKATPRGLYAALPPRPHRGAGPRRSQAVARRQPAAEGRRLPHLARPGRSRDGPGGLRWSTRCRPRSPRSS
ncbi:hypothetical protein HDC37_003389 [Microbacterium sp. AK009]|uniref:hypothetical protein n=1 Tax=Microbacterium sp. AK009 TaxID=2723068 RepID=UPI0015C83C4C|nr:hypothetical protein [Microbacterium sp. AK009]NYF18524.1 hypothetical protein [Microbacterium sp. AK009]